jgi:uncharacterized protein
MKTLPFVLAVVFAACAATLRAQEPLPGDQRFSSVPTLSVTGRGEVSVPPDLAVVRMGAFAQHQEAAAAQEAVNQTMESVLQAIRQAGVAAEQIQTSSLYLHPIYDHRRGGDEQPRITAYRAEMSVTVRIRDLARTGPVIDAGLRAGANQFQGISFELQNDTNAKSQALQQAVRAAQEKARAMAAALNVQLDHVVDVVESGAEPIRPLYEARAAMDMAMGSPATPIQSGQIQVQAQVTLRYRITGAGLPHAGAQPPEPRLRQDPISAPPPPRP